MRDLAALSGISTNILTGISPAADPLKASNEGIAHVKRIRVDPTTGQEEETIEAIPITTARIVSWGSVSPAPR